MSVKMRTFVLSFFDHGKNNGIAVIEVTPTDAFNAKLMLDRRPGFRPGHYAKNAEWAAAAMGKAWETGCNPGGQVATVEIDDLTKIEGWPRNTLMTEEQVRRLVDKGAES